MIARISIFHLGPLPLSIIWEHVENSSDKVSLLCTCRQAFSTFCKTLQQVTLIVNSSGSRFKVDPISTSPDPGFDTYPQFNSFRIFRYIDTRILKKLSLDLRLLNPIESVLCISQQGDPVGRIACEAVSELTVLWPEKVSLPFSNPLLSKRVFLESRQMLLIM
jgi:hypothetical protein